MKVKRLLVSAELFLQLFHGGEHTGYCVSKFGVPEDAELINVRHAWPNVIELLIRSESFPSVKLGDEIPDFSPVISAR